MYDPLMKRAINREVSRLCWEHGQRYWGIFGEPRSAKESFDTALSIGLKIGMESMYRYIVDLSEGRISVDDGKRTASQDREPKQPVDIRGLPRARRS